MAEKTIPVFVPNEEVWHPETNGILIFKGVPYEMKYVQEWADRYGIDIVQGAIVFVEA